MLRRSGDSTRDPTESLVVLESPVTGAGPQASRDFPAFRRAYLTGLRAELPGGLEPVVRPDARVDGHPAIVVDVRGRDGRANAVRQIGTVDGDAAFYLQVTLAPGRPQAGAYAALDAVRSSWRWRWAGHARRPDPRRASGRSGATHRPAGAAP